MKHLRWVLPWLSLLASAPLGAAGPEFLESYKAGLDAIESEDWRRAEGLMERAIAGRGEASRRLPKFLYLKPYLPHFYLGLASFKQDDCDGALRAWAISERQGVVQSRPQYEQIELARELCRQREKNEAVAPSPPPPAVPRAEVVPSPRAPAATSPVRASPSARSPVRDDDGARAATRRELPPPVRGEGVDDWNGDAPMRRAPVVEGTPPEALRAAAVAWLDGDYGRVLDGLAAEKLPAAAAQAHAHLLMAAAELALYLASGERDAPRLERARQHVLTVRSAEPGLEPPERYFSPRFLDFFYGQRPEEAR